LRRIDRLTDYRKSPRANRLPRRSRIDLDAALTYFRWVLARRIEAEGNTVRAA